ncbi:MAG: hypothetical protein ACMUIP_15445 [bacterium]
MKKRFKFVWIIIIISVFASCAGSSQYMELVPEYDTFYEPEAHQSLVIFMRPSSAWFPMQSVIFDVKNKNKKELVGMVSAKKKVAYLTTPGKHLFMAVGNNADFMVANLAGGKSYYALVTPKIGGFKPNFYLSPIHQDELHSKAFQKKMNSCKYAETTEGAYDWASKNAPKIHAKMKTYYKLWKEKPYSQRPMLYTKDGL